MVFGSLIADQDCPHIAGRLVGYQGPASILRKQLRYIPLLACDLRVSAHPSRTPGRVGRGKAAGGIVRMHRCGTNAYCQTRTSSTSGSPPTVAEKRTFKEAQRPSEHDVEPGVPRLLAFETGAG